MWITILIQSRVLNAAYPPVHREKGEGQGRADHHNYIPFSCKKHLILKEVPPPFFLGACKNVKKWNKYRDITYINVKIKLN